MKRNVGFVALETLVKKAVVRRGLRRGVLAAQAVQSAQDFLRTRFNAEEKMAYLQAITLKAGALWVNCKSAAAAAEIRLLAADLQQYVNHTSRRTLVKTVRIVLG